MNKFLLTILFAIAFFSCKEEKEKDTVAADKKIVEIPNFIKEMIATAKKDSINTDLKLKIVTSLDSLGFYKEALSRLDELITKDSLNNVFWLERGLICKQSGDTLAAIKSFKYAAKIYPTPSSLMELANLYAETKNPLTLSISKQLLEMNPGGDYNAQAYLLVGIYYAKIGDKTNALTFYNKSIAEDFHFSEAYLEKGYLLYNDKKYADALKNFTQLTQVNQTFADGYYWQAKCLEALNDRANSKIMYQKTIQLDTNIIEAAKAIERLSK